MVLDPEDTLASDGRLGLWARVTEGAGLQEGLMPRHSRGVWSEATATFTALLLAGVLQSPAPTPHAKYSPQQSCPQL